MFALFTAVADWFVYKLLGLPVSTKLADALHFFIEDTLKIFVLLVVMIYVISLFRASLDVEFVRAKLTKMPRSAGYISGAMFGALTPFCSCSSIPLFLGFTTAGIPVGITLSFLLTSPLINEVAVVLLLGLLGWKFALLYILVGLCIGVLGGALLDVLHAERGLQPFVAKAAARAPVTVESERAVISFKDRHEFAKAETSEIFGRVWKWVLIGVGLGAALHGFVPDNWVTEHLGEGQWWSVPAAVLLGIPLYSNATGVIPVMESLLNHGLPLGTTLAFCMSTVAASFPEFILLKQVMRWPLLAGIFVMLLVAFTLAGWLINLLSPLL
jgi:uncharacterized membrane protein YraQ (UPF0718 family)